jgi:hypothetical protein
MAIKADVKVFLDACVLADIAICDLMLRLAERPRQYRPLWSGEVLAETRRTQLKLGWPERLAESFESRVREVFPEALVEGYEHLLGVVDNHPKDKHVVAAAAHAGAELILTFNLKDFPDDALAPWGLRAVHPQDYLLTLYSMDRLQVVTRVAGIAAKRGEDEEDVLIRFGRALPKFATMLLDDLDLN